MALLDVNALVSLAWDSHAHHYAVRAWFAANRANGWATCPVTESGFVRVSSNPKVLPSVIPVQAARGVLSALCESGDRRFLSNDVSLTALDVPTIVSHRQVTDAQLLTRRAPSRRPLGDLRRRHRRSGRRTRCGAAHRLKISAPARRRSSSKSARIRPSGARQPVRASASAREPLRTCFGIALRGRRLRRRRQLRLRE